MIPCSDMRDKSIYGAAPEVSRLPVTARLDEARFWIEAAIEILSGTGQGKFSLRPLTSTFLDGWQYAGGISRIY